MKFRFNFLLVMLALAGCELRQAMYDNGRIKPHEASDFFADGRSVRPQVENTIARGQLQEDDLLHRGKINGRPANVFPFSINYKDLLRGQERYQIFCSVCHGHAGRGDGMVVQRGFKVPPSLHEERLKQAPAGWLFHVISNGMGAMAAYRTMIPVEDRWKIVAYIRALQSSQSFPYSNTSSEERKRLEEAKK